jgi:hypothetical protein
MLEQVCQLARIAGDAIMEVYDGKQPMDVASKKDDSPVTAADLAAHKVIISGLLALTPDIPVLSEEDPPGWEVRQHWQRYWLVDPLEGRLDPAHHRGRRLVSNIDTWLTLHPAEKRKPWAVEIPELSRQAWELTKAHCEALSEAGLVSICLSRDNCLSGTASLCA